MDFVIPYIPLIFLCFSSYLLGSVPFGLILTKIFLKQDIRSVGSGNIGTTNVLRTGNKGLALLTLILDFSKAALAAHQYHFIYTIMETSADSILFDFSNALILALFAILGHCFPVWLKFKGGKGVATTLGALLAAVPYAGLAACAAWLTTAFLFKISSLAALVAVAIAPIVTFFIYGAGPAGICILITVLVWIRHTENIKRLLKGEEPKIGKKA